MSQLLQNTLTHTGLKMHASGNNIQNDDQWSKHAGIVGIVTTGNSPASKHVT